MSFEDRATFDTFTDDVPDVPIDRLQELQRRAKELLQNRTHGQLEVASETIDWLVKEYFDKEKEKWILDQLEQGGPVLRFLKYEYRTWAGLSDLIDYSYEVEVTREFEFPRAENTSELDALENSLNSFDLDDAGFPNAQVYEYVAALALEQIARALNAFFDDDWPSYLKSDKSMIKLRGLADDSISIMETVCRAEALEVMHQFMKRAELLFRDNMDKAIPAEAEALARKKISLTARMAASARHKDTNDQKTAAITEWEASGSQYSGMAPFARHRHKAYGVTDRTLYGWIRDHRKAKT